MLDSRAARQASWRSGQGVQFRVSEPRKVYRGQNCVLTLASVQWARAWACGDGWGRTRIDQAAFLSRQLRVSPKTIVDLLKNQSWYDPAYTPDEPDPAVWGGLSPAVAMLRLMV